MNKLIVILGIFIILNFFISCPTTSNAMGEQSIVDSRYIPMVDIYNVLKDNFTDYEIMLEEKPESSSFMIYPPIGKKIVKAHYYISMVSENYKIHIQNGINEYGELTDIFIIYYINTKDAHDARERINKLNEPMEKMKLCLINNFNDIIKNENFIQKFKPLPFY
jgi:hypothetical protein